MRIPFPERIPPWHAGIFAAILCTIGILEGTPALFSLFIFIYIMLATVAFNIAGGLYRASGTFVFANAVFSLILAVVVKVFINEPADSNLRDPMVSIIVYSAGMGAILIAAVVSRRFAPKKAVLDTGSTTDDYRQIAAGCVAVGIFMPFIAAYFNSGSGSLGSAMNQFQYFLPLGLVLGTYHEIRSSNGKSSMNGIILAGSLFSILYGGILGASKTALFTPLVSYLVVCAALRYRLRLQTIAGISLVSFIMLYYLVPYDQVVRNYTRDVIDLSDRWDVSMYWLKNMDEVRVEYELSNADVALGHGPHFYNEDRGILERFGRIAMDDALINITDINGTFGYQPIIVAVENLVPHVLWANKPDYIFNNLYGHEIGLLAYDDTTTSISFGASADGYHMGGWYGVFLLMPVVMMVTFLIVDTVAGSIKTSPWGLLFTVYYMQIASEVTLGGCIDTAILSTSVLVLTVYMARHIFPALANIILPEQRRLRFMRLPRHFPKTANVSVTDTRNATKL